jgi:hypothetical protein
MRKLLYLGLFLFSSLISDTLILKSGWNLIGIPSTNSASILSNNSQIEKATGGGVGNTNSFVYLKSINFSRGNFLLGSAYWVKALSDTTLEYTKTSTPNKISLKTGWNLIYPFNTILASEFSKYPQIEKATGGGVGNTNSFVYLKSINFARGESLPNQGYWVKATSAFDLIFQGFDYRAWGIGGDGNSSKAIVRINGIGYTVLVYSKLNIEQSNANSSGEFTFLRGTALNKTVSELQINADYNTKEVKLKFFDNQSIFDDTTLIYESNTLIANNDIVNYEFIDFVNPNDYSIPQPENIDGLNPPKSPLF